MLSHAWGACAARVGRAHADADKAVQNHLAHASVATTSMYLAVECMARDNGICVPRRAGVRYSVSHRSGQGTLWPSTGSDAIGVFLTRVVADQQLPFASRHQTLAKERADRGVPGRAVRRRAVDRLRRGALALVDHPGPPRASAALSVRDRHGSGGLDERAFDVHCRSFRPRLTAWNAAWLCRRAIPLPKTDGACAGGTGAVALGNGTNSPPAEIRPKDGVPPGSQID